MHPIFHSIAYDTPAGQQRAIGDRLCLNTRLYFVLRYLPIVFNASSLARKGRFDDEQWNRHSLLILRLLEQCGGRFHISGFDHAAAHPGPVVFVSNHMSTMETMLFPGLLNPIKPVTFVVKKSLVDFPVFGPVMRSRDPVVVERRHPREDLLQVLEEGAKRLAAGRSVVIFPESTRQKCFDPANFNSLGVKLARRCGVPVQPIAIRTDFWGNGRLLRDLGPLRRRQPIHMVIGAPISFDDNGKAAHEACISFILEHTRTWGNACPE